MSSWLDVESSIRLGDRDAPWKDRIILSILDRHKADRRSEWRSILLLLFWRDLESIAGWLRRLDSTEATLRTNVQWSFYEAVCRLDASTRAVRMIQKIRNDTVHGVKRVYAKERSRLDRWGPVYRCDESGEERRMDLTAPDDPDWVEMIARLETRASVRFLNSFAQQGRIADRDVSLLIGTLIYGQTIEDWAADQGISKECAKKRRQRALTAIRRHSNHLQES